VTGVAVTGVGLVTALGVGTEKTWEGLVAGRSGVDTIRAYDPSSLHTQIAAEIDGFDPEEFAHRRTLRTMTRNDQLSLAAATLALRDAGLEGFEDGDRAGLFVGSSKDASDPVPVLEATLTARNDDGSVDLRRLGENASSLFYPLFYVEGLQAASLFYISQTHGMKGANCYFAGGAEASAIAIGRAYRAVLRGEADVVLAGGWDDGSFWWNMVKYDTLGILTERNDLGAGACRPFDAERDGTVLGEGGAFLVLEPLDAAQKRGATPYAVITGFGSAFDNHRLITPDPQGSSLTRAIEAALKEGGTEAGEIAYVAAHGSGTKLGDVSEAQALERVFGTNGVVAASSVKPATGHLLGGAGALNAAVAALAIGKGTIPPTLNLKTPDPACRLDWVPGEARETEVGAALAVARGFEGQNVALAMRAI
jgi:3-oxoacyl-[acyl-carrier-protein] synthase II